jgi:hypothetical protein
MPTITILDVETSGRFDINNLHVGRSWPSLVFKRWTSPKKTAAEDYPEGTYRLEIFTDREYKTDPVMTIEEGSGLTVANELLTITRNETENTLKARQYYYRVICEVDADNSHQIIHGVLNVDY